MQLRWAQRLVASQSVARQPATTSGVAIVERARCAPHVADFIPSRRNTGLRTAPTACRGWINARLLSSAPPSSDGCRCAAQCWRRTSSSWLLSLCYRGVPLAHNLSIYCRFRQAQLRKCSVIIKHATLWLSDSALGGVSWYKLGGFGWGLPRIGA